MSGDLALVVHLPSCSSFPRSCCRFEYGPDYIVPTQYRHHGYASCQRTFWQGRLRRQVHLVRAVSFSSRDGLMPHRNISHPCMRPENHHKHGFFLCSVSQRCNYVDCRTRFPRGNLRYRIGMITQRRPRKSRRWRLRTR